MIFKLLICLLTVIIMLVPISEAKANEIIPESSITIATGGGTNYVIKDDGSLWAWGGGWDSLWYEDEFPTTSRKIMENVVAVSAGTEHAVAIKTDDSLWGWGWNEYGQLGDGTNINRSTPVKIMENVTAVSAGAWNTMAIRTDGSLWAWGSNVHGISLPGDDARNIYTPVKIMDNVIAVSTNAAHTMVIKADGSLWAWGLNSVGQLGDDTTTNRATPVKVMDDMVAVSAGFEHTLAIKADGSLWSWGSNEDGQLGDGTTTDRHSPVRIMNDVVTVSAGINYSKAIRGDGSLWTWGGNAVGQLGDGTFIDRHSPVRIMGDVAVITAVRFHVLWVDIDSGYSMAVRTDGSLWGWCNQRTIYDGSGNVEFLSTPYPAKLMTNVMLPGGRTPQPIPTIQTQLRFIIGQTQFTHNSTPRTADVAPFIDPVYNRTMVPLRIIAEAFGAEARWNSATRTAHITGAGVNLSLNADTPLPGGMGIPMNVNGNIFVPLAYVAQQFGATTRWDRDTRAVYVVQ